MGNCLKTQLKQAVNNDNLNYLGFIQLIPKTGFDVKISSIDAAQSITFKAVGGYVIGGLKPGGIQNEEYSKAIGPYPAMPNIGIASGSSGYVGIKYSDNENGVIVPTNVKLQLTLEELANLLPNSIFGFLGRATEYAGNPKISKWLDLISDSPANISRVERVVTALSNVENDDIRAASFGKFINMKLINLYDTRVIPSEFANAMVLEGRVKGSLEFVISSIGNVIAKFGSDMVNPTAEETAQGWQIVAA